MEVTLFIWSLLLNILSTTLLLSVLTYGCAKVLLSYTPDLWNCFAWNSLIAAIYVFVVAPRRSPLRKLPVVHIDDVRLIIPVTDAPRGKAALEWAKQYPNEDMIRIRVRGAEVLVPLSTNALRDIFSTKQADFIKPLAGRNSLSALLGNGLILAEGHVHDRQRKQLTSSFRVQNIRALHKLMLAKASLFIRGMEADCNQNGKCDITVWGSKVTLDIIGAALMNKEFDSLRVENQPVNDAFTELTAASPGQTLLFIFSLFLPKFLLDLVPTETNRTAFRAVAVVRNVCKTVLEEVVAGKGDGNVDTDTNILKSIMADPLASEEEVIDQMVTFLSAGHETTATTIAWITHLLTLPENERYQRQLREELDGNPDCISSPSTLESLPWLNAICEETLRLFPAVTTTGRKAIRNTTIAGVPIPEGAPFVVFPWAINRDPRHWGGDGVSEQFIPERWIDARPDGSMHVNSHGGASSNFCNMTFLQGNRSCIGKGFAKAELRLIIAKVFGTFEVRRLAGDNLIANPVGSLTIKPEGGLFVNLKRIE